MGFKKFIKKYWWTFVLIAIIVIGIIIYINYPTVAQTGFDPIGGAGMSGGGPR